VAARSLPRRYEIGLVEMARDRRYPTSASRSRRASVHRRCIQRELEFALSVNSKKLKDLEPLAARQMNLILKGETEAN
jgi:hypothetical protein